MIRFLLLSVYLVQEVPAITAVSPCRKQLAVPVIQMITCRIGMPLRAIEVIGDRWGSLEQQRWTTNV